MSFHLVSFFLGNAERKAICTLPVSVRESLHQISCVLFDLFFSVWRTNVMSPESGMSGSLPIRAGMVLTGNLLSTNRQGLAGIQYHSMLLLSGHCHTMCCYSSILQAEGRGRENSLLLVHPLLTPRPI